MTRRQGRLTHRQSAPVHGLGLRMPALVKIRQSEIVQRHDDVGMTCGPGRLVKRQGAAEPGGGGGVIARLKGLDALAVEPCSLLHAACVRRRLGPGLRLRLGLSRSAAGSERQGCGEDGEGEQKQGAHRGLRH